MDRIFKISLRRYIGCAVVNAWEATWCKINDVYIELKKMESTAVSEEEAFIMAYECDELACDDYMLRETLAKIEGIMNELEKNTGMLEMSRYVCSDINLLISKYVV